MRAVRLKVTAQLLEDVLHMPSDMRILGSIGFGLSDLGMVELIVESPKLDDVAIETVSQLPEAEPLVIKHQARLEWKLGDVALGDGRGRIR